MQEDNWPIILVSSLAVNAAIGFGYRVYRLAKGGPIADVWGQALLGLLLAAIAIGVALGAAWMRWIALGYALLFGVVVMPVWILGVLLPLRPKTVDYAFTISYWIALVVIGVASIALG
jgi:hypothetical protein